MEYIETQIADTGEPEGTTLVMQVPLGIQNGYLMVMQIGARGGTNVTIPTPTGWSLASNTPTGTVVRMATFVRFANNEPASYTVTLSIAQQAVGAISCWSDVYSWTTNGSNNSGTSANPMAFAITTTYNYELVLAMYAFGSGSDVDYVFGPIPPANMSECYQIQSPATLDTDRVTIVCYEMIVVEGTGSVGNKTAPAFISGSWAAQMLAFRPKARDLTPQRLARHGQARSY